jgi:hypothetical protein
MVMLSRTDIAASFDEDNAVFYTASLHQASWSENFGDCTVGAGTTELIVAPCDNPLEPIDMKVTVKEWDREQMSYSLCGHNGIMPVCITLRRAASRMLKKSASFVLGRPSPCDVADEYASVAGLPAASLDGLFDHPAGCSNHQ